MANSIKLFSGSSHPELAKEVAKHLKIPLSKMHLERFACGEIYTKPDETVRGADAFVIQTGTQDSSEDLMELFVMLDSLKRSFAGKLHVVMPHYPYARQDRVATPREPITAKLVADLISTAGADHLMGIKFHSDQEQGFFDFPVDNLNTNKLFADYFKKKKLKNLVVVSPDAGGAKDAKSFGDLIGAKLAIIHKTRPAHNKAEVMHMVGDVKGKNCIIFDDIVDTGGSVGAAVDALKKYGAKDIYFAVTHPVLSGPAIERLEKAGFKEIVVTNTIPIKKKFKGLKVLSVAPLLAQIIKSVHEQKSVTQYF